MGVVTGSKAETNGLGGPRAFYKTPATDLTMSRIHIPGPGTTPTGPTRGSTSAKRKQGKYVSNTYSKAAGINAMAIRNHEESPGPSQANAIQQSGSNRKKKTNFPGEKPHK